MGVGAGDGPSPVERTGRGLTSQVEQPPNPNPRLEPPTMSALITFVLTGYAAGYFLLRFIRFKKFVSLALVLMVSGWACCMAILMNYITRSHYGAVRTASVVVTVLMVFAILWVENRSEYTRKKTAAKRP